MKNVGRRPGWELVGGTGDIVSNVLPTIIQLGNSDKRVIVITICSLLLCIVQNTKSVQICPVISYYVPKVSDNTAFT